MHQSNRPPLTALLAECLAPALFGRWLAAPGGCRGTAALGASDLALCPTSWLIAYLTEAAGLDWEAGSPCLAGAVSYTGDHQAYAMTLSIEAGETVLDEAPVTAGWVLEFVDGLVCTPCTRAQVQDRLERAVEVAKLVAGLQAAAL